MQKKILINLVIVSLCGIILTSIVLYIIQTAMAHNATKETLTLHLENIAERILLNEQQIQELTAAAKEDYLSRARALAMMIELEPSILENKERINEAAVALNIDEIHIINEDGILWCGTHPEYYGMDFALTEQTRPFLAILEDPELEISQDPMPNGARGLMRQYAAVSLHNTKGIAQIGMVPERLEEALKNNQICNVLRDVIIGNTGYIFAVSVDEGTIISHPNERLKGTRLPEPFANSNFMIIDGKRVMYDTLKTDKYILTAAIPATEVYARRTFYMVIFTSFMTILFVAFCFIVSIHIKVNLVDNISKTVKTLEEISNGNLDITADIRSSVEFVKLSDGINHMLFSIKAKMDEITTMTESMRRLGAIAAIADAGIIVKDKDGVVDEWNIGAETILGYKPEEIIGKTTKAYAPEEAHAGIDKIEERLKKGEHIAHVEVIRKHRDGRIITCSASYTPIKGDDVSFTGSVAIFHDISDKKQIEQELQEAVIAAEQANRAKSSFLANMSHEIRTPMNGIIGFAELATDEPNIPEKTKDYLEKIKVSGRGLMQILNDILDISKIEAGKMEFEHIPFNLKEVLDLCKTITGSKADEKGILLFFYNEPQNSKKLLGDPTKLSQVLLNLLSNAIKFTDKGMVKLVVDIINSNSDTVSVYFEVRDNGIGMTQEQINKIFKPFTQADTSMTRKYGGTGLGLAISKNIIELMGGKLEVESKPGIGSKFSFTLTYKIVEESETVTENIVKKDRSIAKPIFKADALVCEDNVINQQVIKEHLLRVGVNATIAANGKLGVEEVLKRKGNPFDIIFMDIHMPLMDGLEASEELRRIGNKTPVIALTANVMSDDKEKYLKSGMCDFLAKPFMAKELWECLIKYLEPVNIVDEHKSDVLEETDIISRQYGIDYCGGDEELYDQLLLRFLNEGKNKLQDIIKAMDVGDMTLAHRTAHTLNGEAGTLGAKKLKIAAKDVEISIKNNKSRSIIDAQMEILETELNIFFEALKPLVLKSNGAAKLIDLPERVNARELIDRLTPLLKACNMQSIELTPIIKESFYHIPLAATLVKQIRDCDFELAYETLEKIKKQLIG